MINKGFFELPKETGAYTSGSSRETICYHPEHNPPSHLNVPKGYGYRHECPRCGAVQIIKNDLWTFHYD